MEKKWYNKVEGFFFTNGITKLRFISRLSFIRYSRSLWNSKLLKLFLKNLYEGEETMLLTANIEKFHAVN